MLSYFFLLLISDYGYNDLLLVTIINAHTRANAEVRLYLSDVYMYVK